MRENRADVEYQLAIAQTGHDGRRSQTQTASQLGIAENGGFDFDHPGGHGLVRQRTSAGIGDVLSRLHRR